MSLAHRAATEDQPQNRSKDRQEERDQNPQKLTEHTVVAALGDRHNSNDEDDQANDAKTETNRIHGLNLTGVALSTYEFAGCRVAIPR